MLSPSYIILRIQRPGGNSVDLDEVAHDESSHQDLHCLQIQLFSSVALKELTWQSPNCSLRYVCISSTWMFVLSILFAFVESLSCL